MRARMVMASLPSWRLMNRINGDVNNSITYRRDKDVHNRIDYWQKPEETLELKTGDCEDYAILKAWRLVNAGVPSSVLRIAVVSTPDSPPNHAVLFVPSMVTTGLLWWKKQVERIFVLDNVRDEIVAWDKSPYQLINIHTVEKFIDAA